MKSCFIGLVIFDILDLALCLLPCSTSAIYSNIFLLLIIPASQITLHHLVWTPSSFRNLELKWRKYICKSKATLHVFFFLKSLVWGILARHCTSFTQIINWFLIATLGPNLGILTLLEILQPCKLDHKVAWFSTWLQPPPTTARSKILSKGAKNLGDFKQDW